MSADLDRRDDLTELSEIATAVALSVVLGNLKLLELPNGGSIAFGTLPILLLAAVRGFRPAFLAGWCAGLLHAVFGGTIIHPGQLLLDYGLAYALLAVACLATGGGRVRMAGAVLLAGVAHLSCFVLSGTLFFAEYAVGHSVLLFSLGYNALHVLPEIVLAAALLPVLVRAYARSDVAIGYRLGLLSPPASR